MLYKLNKWKYLHLDMVQEVEEEPLWPVEVPSLPRWLGALLLEPTFDVYPLCCFVDDRHMQVHIRYPWAISQLFFF